MESFEKINKSSLEKRMAMAKEEFGDVKEYIDIHDKIQVLKEKIQNLETTKETLKLDLDRLKIEREGTTSNAEEAEIFIHYIEISDQYSDVMKEINELLIEIEGLWEVIYEAEDIETADSRFHEYLRERGRIERQFLPPQNLGKN